MNPLHRHDHPTDYQALWNGLKRRLNELRIVYSAQAASAKEMIEVRQCQGAYRAMSTIESEMDLLLDEARAEKRAS